MRQQDTQRVLFICTHNSARSQMAEGLLRQLYGGQYQAFSAGVSPAHLHPLAIEVMAEIGIDISHQRAKDVSELAGEQFDWVITVCDEAKESCPTFPGAARYFHWSLVDPSQAKGDDEQRLAVFRRVRDEIRSKVEETFG